MPISNWICTIAIAVFAVLSSNAWAQGDMTGSRDHPEIPRIEGAQLRGYAYSDFDKGEFITAFKDGQLEMQHPTGKRTRLLYIVPSSISVVQVFANYGTALDELGEKELIYSCDTDCAYNLGDSHIWTRNRQISTNIRNSNFIYGSGSLSYRDHGYAYLTVTNESARYHVSVYTAFLTGLQAPTVGGMRAIHVEIVEEADFKPTLQVVTSDEIVKGIADDGRIALYGIYFDFDSDVLKAESSIAIGEIAKALQSDGSLVVYVVGHTDNQGEYAYNLSLSDRRAAAVVTELVEKHGIARTRLIPVGVGPVAPVASNRTEDGQALNRRVELVER